MILIFASDDGGLEILMGYEGSFFGGPGGDNLVVAAHYSAGRQALAPSGHHRLCGFRRIEKDREDSLCKQAYNTAFPVFFCPSQCWSMFSINIPYPLVES